MPRLSSSDLLERVLTGIGTPSDYLSAFVDRATGELQDEESKYMDMKLRLNVDDEAAIAELSRDILGFSNTSGGLLLFGVSDQRKVIGHEKLDYSDLREKLGPFLGTFVEYEIGTAPINVVGRELLIPYFLIPRCLRSHPNLLRRDIFERRTVGGRSTRFKYMRGSLFFREGSSTRVEPVGGDVEKRSLDLGFSAPMPKAGSAFLFEEDKPGMRVYSHINDKFVGREQELGELLSKFDDPRGRGISLAGMGGIGKTELAIEVVIRAFKSRRFTSIYSGSAKKSIYSAIGARETDPCFSDFPGLLRDLGAWLGLDFRSQTPLEEMKRDCLEQLRKVQRPLLFVDNLETIQDHRVFDFLDRELPNNVWLLTTSRVHKVKNYLYAKQLDYMLPGDDARLLRSELKRQGLQAYADMSIEVLEKRAIQLQRHPLLIRWYVWQCRRAPDSWAAVPRVPPRSDVESFCIGQTLSSLSPIAQRVLAAVAATEEQTDVTPECLRYVTGVDGPEVEMALYDIESAGLVVGAVDPLTGAISYTSNSMAKEPARELARKNDWETGYSRGFRNYQAACGGESPPDPLVRSLIEFDAVRIKNLSPAEIQELENRIDRALQRPHAYHNQLLALKAECERHSDHMISADAIYREAADGVLSAKKNIDLRSARILLEAATVARAAFQTEQQFRRAILYLEAIKDHDIVPLRVYGMLIEMCASIGDRERYETYRTKALQIKESEASRFTKEQSEAFLDALLRAASLTKAWKN